MYWILQTLKIRLWRRPVQETGPLGLYSAQKEEDEKIHPVLYESRTMKKSERKYDMCEKEALAVIIALKKFRFYVLSAIQFHSITDHQALKHAFQEKDVNRGLARWL